MERLILLAMEEAKRKWASYVDKVYPGTMPIFVRSALIDLLRRDLDNLVISFRGRSLSQEQAEVLVDQYYPLGRDRLEQVMRMPVRKY